jgi:hypothetical protein
MDTLEKIRKAPVVTSDERLSFRLGEIADVFRSQNA